VWVGRRQRWSVAAGGAGGALPPLSRSAAEAHVGEVRRRVSARCGGRVRVGKVCDGGSLAGGGSKAGRPPLSPAPGMRQGGSHPPSAAPSSPIAPAMTDSPATADGAR
jgi:hypothetical protein